MAVVLSLPRTVMFFLEIGRCLLRDTKLDVDHDLAGRMGLYPF